MVLRSSPYFVATSSSSAETTSRKFWSLERIASSDAMSSSNAARSVSSSIFENLVRRRNLSSRMYSACSSERSKICLRRVLASSTSSLLRITWITSSIETIAISNPSTKWSRAFRFPRRFFVRRFVTMIRCDRYTPSISFNPRVCGLPSTKATLLMPNESSIGVNR